MDHTRERSSFRTLTNDEPAAERLTPEYVLRSLVMRVTSPPGYANDQIWLDASPPASTAFTTSARPSGIHARNDTARQSWDPSVDSAPVSAFTTRMLPFSVS